MNTRSQKKLFEAVKANKVNFVKHFIKLKGLSVNVNHKEHDTALTALMMASEKGYFDIVECLVKQGKAQLDTQDDEGYSALHKAVKNDHVDIVKLLVERGADMNLPSIRQQTSLYFAARQGNLDIVKILIGNGANVDCMNDGLDFTPLHVACCKGRFEVSKFLIEVGKADMNKGTGSCLSPLYFACESGHLDLVKYLLDKGASLVTGFEGEIQVMQIAAEMGHIEIVNILLERGALNEAVYAEKSPLMMSVEAGHLEAVKLFIGLGWSLNVGLLIKAIINNRMDVVTYFIESRPKIINELDEWESSPIVEAVRNANFEAVELLIGNGADINSNLLIEAIINNHMDIVKCIVENRPKVINQLDEQGSSPIVKAVKNANKEAVKLLIGNGADINSSLLIKAIINNHMDIVKCFIENRPKVINQLDEQGSSPIVKAVRSANFEAVKLLIGNGADINSSLLIEAIINNHMDIVRYFIENRPNVINQPDEQGSSPLIEAVRNANIEAVKLLIKHGAEIKKAFFEIVKMGNADALKVILLNGGFNVDELSPDGKTALMMAAEEGHAEVFKVLLKEGKADFWVKDAEGKTVLKYEKRPSFVALILVQLQMDELRNDLNDTEEEPQKLQKLSDLEYMRFILANGNSKIQLQCFPKAEPEAPLTCPVCYDAPGGSPVVIYSCGGCDNWVCGACKPRLERCPMCRCCMHHMKRNKTVERIIESLKNSDKERNIDIACFQMATVNVGQNLIISFPIFAPPYDRNV